MAFSNSASEFHHYIPQFILRNFSHKYTGRRNKRAKLHPGDPALNVVDLTGSEPSISQSPVKRTFGKPDMYRDHFNTADQYYLEKELGKLEARASTIIAGAKRALESGNAGVSMSRTDRDVLRKFLFIMKFRGPSFFNRFHGDVSGRYVQDDKEQFEKYMEEKGYRNAVDVWFKSIKAILELKMDVQGTWKQKLLAEIYPDDAKWFFMHTEMHYLAFCTPENPNDEFILTENCYNVYEGPSNTILNPDTGEYEICAWSSYHELCPVTPKLMLVLRSALLPEPDEDLSEDIRECRRILYESNQRMFTGSGKSSLEDLPIKKPRNSYTQVRDGRMELLPGEDGSRRPNHRFTFQFFKIGTEHVLKINSYLLENAHLTSTIAFESKDSLQNTLSYYLHLPPESGFKLIHRPETNPRMTYLTKLKATTTLLGSTATLSYKEIPGLEQLRDLAKARKQVLAQMLTAAARQTTQQPNDFMKLYLKLGGSPDLLPEDMEQVDKMRFLRIKIDVCTRRFPENTRERVRNNLRDIFCHDVLPRRLWMYLKTLRHMSLGSPETLMECMKSEGSDGPEDVIVKASDVVRPECLGLLLHFTVMQDIQHRRNPGLGPSSDFTLDEPGALLARKIRNLTFSPVGSICNCGIPVLQDFAMQSSTMLRLTKAYVEFQNPLWTTEENIEMFTRSIVRGEAVSLLSGKLSRDVIQELVDVLFNVVYPTYKQAAENETTRGS